MTAEDSVAAPEGAWHVYANAHENGMGPNVRETGIMAVTQKKLFDDALKLPLKLRAQLAEELIASLDDDKTADSIVAEAERRWRNFKAGKTKGVPAEVLFPSLRRKLTKKKS